jgi:hypothetical protein
MHTIIAFPALSPPFEAINSHLGAFKLTPETALESNKENTQKKSTEIGRGKRGTWARPCGFVTMPDSSAWAQVRMGEKAKTPWIPISYKEFI